MNSSLLGKILIIEKSYNTVSFSEHRPPSLNPSLHKQAGTSSMWVLTDTTLPTGAHPRPPPSNSLLCCALLGLALPFSAKSQIGGWGVFCGPNKRAKVVRTPLYESVGGGAVTQTASLSGLGLHGPTGLGCSLATVTHGEREPEWEKRGCCETGFRKDSWSTSEDWSPTYAGSTEYHAGPIQSGN